MELVPGVEVTDAELAMVLRSMDIVDEVVGVVGRSTLPLDFFISPARDKAAICVVGEGGHVLLEGVEPV